MYDYDIKDKPKTKKRSFPYFSVGLIIVGAAILIGGIIYYNNTDMDKYYTSSLSEVSEQIDGGKISSVDIDISAGAIYVGKSEDGQVRLEGTVPKDYVLKENGGTLRIELEPHSKMNMFGINKNNVFDWETIDARIYLPAKAYDEFLIDVGAGEVTIEDIECNTAKVDSGAGEITVNNMTCKGVLKADTGAGKIDISGAVTGGLKLSVGAGEISYAGTVNGDIDASCGVGECDIALTDSEEEYSKKYTVSTSVGMGDVTVSYGD